MTSMHIHSHISVSCVSERTGCKMAPKLYGIYRSPGVRATLLAISAMGLDIEFLTTDPLYGEHLTPKFLNMNPQHTVPTLKDGDFVIWDSHAINAYLVGKYGKDDSLYPKDLEKRAVVDQRLFFDCGVLFEALRALAVPIFRDHAKSVSKEAAESTAEAYASLETLLERSTYVAGEELTIADFSIVSTISTANILVPIATNRFPKITAWISKMEALPYYAEANQKGLDMFASLIKSKLS